jgi:hypothetical protein
MERIVLPELLDVLPPRDPAARRSRRELRRVNAWMRHPQIMARALRQNVPAQTAPQVVELGAGDGHFLLAVAGGLRGRWRGAQAILVDQMDALAPQLSEQFRQLGWEARLEIAEAAAWLRQAQPRSAQIIISNLFFHQFQTAQLAEMLRLAAVSARVVIALEPRRSWLARLGGRLLWVIGCGPVTRHDAHLSIRAGFSGKEISSLWPDPKNWELVERPAGLFSHLFIARRKN